VNANAHLIGSEVSVVQKHDQGTGRLTQGIVSEIFTNSASGRWNSWPHLRRYARNRILFRNGRHRTGSTKTKSGGFHVTRSACAESDDRPAFRRDNRRMGMSCLHFCQLGSFTRMRIMPSGKAMTRVASLCRTLSSI
jgi:hypothetical protein